MELSRMEIQQVKKRLVSDEGRDRALRHLTHEEWAIPPVPHSVFAYAEGPFFSEFPKPRDDAALFKRRVWDCLNTGRGYDELFVAWKDRNGFHCHKLEGRTPEGYFSIGAITLDESEIAVELRPL